jgi:glycosyltransferase involved in cell wall biosynthesis
MNGIDKHETLFSVIIPTCGRENLLLECVASIMAGNYKNFEIIIVDQEPNQYLRKRLVDCYPNEDRIYYHFLEEAGASNARNRGLIKAKGKYVAFIDDDAIAVPEWLESFNDTFRTIDPPPALIAGKIVPSWPGKKPEWYPKECEYILGLYDIGDKACVMPEEDQPISANLSGLREAILNLGGFNEKLGPNYFRKHSQITGEDSFLGRSARKVGYLIYYEPQAKVYHKISHSKLLKMKFLQRFFWEGVTVILQMYLIGKLGSKKNHIFYHSKYAIKMLILSIFPGLSRQPEGRKPSPSIRMLHLSQVFFSLGILYAVVDLENIKGRRKCA